MIQIQYKKTKQKPYLIVMCGLPGSGKSTFARNSITIDNGEEVYKPKIYSSDKIRKEIYHKSKITKTENKMLFAEIHERLKLELLSGRDIIFDATSINCKSRGELLTALKDVDYLPVCIYIDAPFSICLQNNLGRTPKKRVPTYVIENMARVKEAPKYEEGFYDIRCISSVIVEDKDIIKRTKRKRKERQENKEITEQFNKMFRKAHKRDEN